MKSKKLANPKLSKSTKNEKPILRVVFDSTNEKTEKSAHAIGCQN